MTSDPLEYDPKRALKKNSLSGQSLNGLPFDPFQLFDGKVEYSKKVNGFMVTSEQVSGLSRHLGRERLKDHPRMFGAAGKDVD